MSGTSSAYRGRLAPSPTGYLHLGHARTFWVAHQRARAARGALVFRSEDLDAQRSKAEFASAMYEDLRWIGLDWDEGPDVGGQFAPYSQSQRRKFYLDAWRKLRDAGAIYPCSCSRKDLEQAAEAPHEEEDEIPYPGTCREKSPASWLQPSGTSWRFRVSQGERISFDDLYFGTRQFIGGDELSDFLIWRRDDVPAYQLAVVVDDAAMRISEVVRGADLLKSTARQLLLLRALGLEAPAYFHCPLLRDEHGIRLAKRHDSLSLRTMRNQGVDPESLRSQFARDVEWQKGL